MALVGGLFSETLHSITTTKLEELSKKRATFEHQYASIQQAASVESDPLKRLIILVDGVKRCFQVRIMNTNIKNPDGSERLGRVISGGTNLVRLETDLKILDRFLDQPLFDPSMSAHRLMEWENTMRDYLSKQNLKYTYAALYGELVTEWLASEKKSTEPQVENVEMSDVFEEVPGGKRLESRKAWEQSVFEPHVIDQSALERYLNNLFGQGGGEETNDLRNALAALRTSVQNFESTLSAANQFSSWTLKWVINGLQASDLLSEEKRSVLKDFVSNETILSEISDVLNMRMAALQHWSWGMQVAVEQRRKLNGTYSIHLDEDLLQAIFLQFIGVKWSVFFKNAFRSFQKHNNVWKPLNKALSKADKKRRQYYLGPQFTGGSLNSKRFRAWRNGYFLFQLPDSDDQRLEVDDGEEEADLGGYGSQAQRPQPRGLVVQSARGSAARPPPAPKAAKRMRRAVAEVSSDGEEDDDDGIDSNAPKRPMDAKQKLLHLLTTEITINTGLDGETSCFRSAFEDWNPMLPHQTILTVMKFFGVSDKWISFFQRFLQAPLKFTDENVDPRIRKRGTPGSHSLSDIFGETILFCLDFSVNQQTDGGLLYRINDDFWFWASDHRKSVRAWQAVESFTQVMGVTLHAAKTGSTRISSNGMPLAVAPLPTGDIRWGFLYLDPRTGRFEIDQSMIEEHIKELSGQLESKQKSIFSWIQAWNTYATTFFTANFGKAANCFGRQHVDKILAAHQHVHRTLFPGDGSVVGYLKRLIKERFGVDGVPDGFLFFPVELGGLSLQSPFVGPLQIRDAILDNPSNPMREFREKEREAYRAAKERFDNGEIANERYALDDPSWEPLEGSDTFISFEEYIKYREDLDYHFEGELSDVFNRLLVKPSDQSIDGSASVINEINALNTQSNLKGITSNWWQMEPYWKWTAQLYGPEMISKFGGLNIVEPGILPVGMVSLFRGQRVQWQG